MPHDEIFTVCLTIDFNVLVCKPLKKTLSSFLLIQFTVQKLNVERKFFLNIKSAIKVSRIVKMTLKSCTERISDIDKVNLAKLFNDGLVFGLSQFLQMPQKLHWIEKWSKLTSN